MIAPPIFEPFLTHARYKIAYGGRGCYPGDTEFMSQDGWKRIDQYEEGDSVLVTDPKDGGSYLTSIVDYVNLPADSFTRIKNCKVDFTTSENHKHLLRNEKTNNIETLTTSQMLHKHKNLIRGVKHKLIRTFDYGGSGIGYSDNYIRLKIAVIADGHFPHDRVFGTCRVNLKKERKIKRLKWLLKINSINYKLTVDSNGFNVFVFKVDNDEKEFNNYWHNCSKHQMKLFCEEVVKWDGCTLERSNRVDAIGFSSISKATIDFVQFAFHCCGIKADINICRNEKYNQGFIYTICVSKHHIESSISKDKSSRTTTEMDHKQSSDGRMYCFTTPTGFFPVRQKGRIYVSGNSGKSWSIGRILIELARRSQIRVLCARELQSSISDSVIQLLSDTIERNGYLKEFDVLKTEIVHKQTGSRFMFYGIRHNITKIKSVEGIDICWVEEAENVQKDSWDVLIPTIRKDGSEIWVSFNPKNILDNTYQRFVTNPPENSVCIKVNYTNNPWFPDVLREEMEECKRLDYELYRHIWEGEPVADSEHAIIKPMWVEASIDAHLRLGFSATGTKQVGYDVSDEGEDASSMVSRIGSVVTKIELWRKRPQEFCTKSVYSYCYMNDVDLLVFDSIGVGAGAKIVIKDLNKDASGVVKSIGFNAGGKVKNPNASFMAGANKKNKDMFANVKAQEWWRVRQRFYNTYLAVKEGADFRDDEMISLSSDLDHLDLLQAELSRPRVDYDRNGRTKVEAKIDMAKRGIPSTNVADGLIMAYSGGLRGSAGLIC